MFFDSWYALFQILITAAVVYFALIVSLRISGKRTLSKWNAFDFIMTVALGSILATVILSEDSAIVEGIIAFVLIILFQFIITWLSVRVQFVQDLVKAEPSLVFNRGAFLLKTMKDQRITKSEIMAAVRESGITALEDVDAVVLETDGSFSVMRRNENESRSALADVKNQDGQEN